MTMQDYSEESLGETTVRSGPIRRCLNDICFSYCIGKYVDPEPAVSDPVVLKELENRGCGYMLGSCKADKNMCPNRRMLSEMVDLSQLPDDGHLIEYMKGPEETGEPNQKKSKKVQKLETEINQQKMF